MSSPAPYIHGTDPLEQERLGIMNRLINPGCLAELHLETGERVLEVGAGLGHFAREMAAAVGAAGRVLGIERDPAQLAVAHSFRQVAQLELRAGDATALPLTPQEVGSFDVAHARYLLEHVPQRERVVAEMVRAVRPGGRIVLADDDHDQLRLSPAVAGFDRLWQAYQDLQVSLGNEPTIGRRLVSLLHGAGARPCRTAQVFYGGCAGQARFQDLVENLVRILSHIREPLVHARLLEGEAHDAAMAALGAWAARPDAALWYTVCWAEGRRP